MRTALVLIISFFSHSLFSQSYMGFKGGVTFNTLTQVRSDPESITSDFGFTFGYIYGYRLNKNFGVQTGIQYIQKGGVIQYEGNSIYKVHNEESFAVLNVKRTQSIRVEAHELEVPILFTYKPIKWFQLSAGPYLDFGIIARGSGGMRFNNVEDRNTGSSLESFTVEIESANLYKGIEQAEVSQETHESYLISGEEYFVPLKQEAFQESPSLSESYLRRFSGGIQGGVHFVLRQGFSLDAIYKYGLLPATNGSHEPDFNSVLPEGNFTTLGDDRYYNTILLSLSFSF